METTNTNNFNQNQGANFSAHEMPNINQRAIKMLASVSNIEEVALALNAGVDIIDLKNPNQGALGALNISEISNIVKLVSGRSPVSATIGDLSELDQISLAIERTMMTGVDIIKVGFFDSIDYQELVNVIKPFTETQKIIAVLFADGLYDLSILPLLKKSGFYGVMLDTAHKNGQNLLDHISLETLKVFITQTKQLNLEVGLAGALAQIHIEKLSTTQPSYIGFRSALCEKSQRKNKLDINKIMNIKKVLQKCNIMSLEAASDELFCK